MKGSEILCGAFGDYEAAALLTDGKLKDLLVDSPHPRPGAIYRARAVRPVKGMGGMFFETPDGTAFLRGAKGISTGDLHLIQVAGYAEDGKAIPVSKNLTFKGRFAIVTPAGGGVHISRAIKDEEKRVELRDALTNVTENLGEFGLIIRSASETADVDAIANDVVAQTNLAHNVLSDKDATLEKLLEGPGPADLALRDWPSAPVRDAELDEIIEQAMASKSSLDGGGSVFVEPTRAFVAIDINTGHDTSPAAGLKANLAAARQVPTLLDIKGLGGQIIIDCAPMSKKHRSQFEAVLLSNFRKNNVETSLAGWTKLGNYELSRKRARAPLHEIQATGNRR